MFLFKYLDKKLTKTFEATDDPLNKVRAEFLIYGLCLSLFVILITLPTFYLGSLYLLLYRSIFIALVQIGLIWMLLNTSKWKIVAHACCVLICLLIFSNITINMQGVKIISLQWMLLLILMSYYLLGTKWGVLYSSISLFFMLFYFALYGVNAMTSVAADESNDFAFISVFSFNFLLIIYLQYHFFNAFNQTIKRLKRMQEEEKLLNEKLKAAVVLAEESVKVKTYFLSTISHELRTPLNGVIGMSDILLLDNPRADQAENLQMLKFSAHNLLSLINDVLDINKIEFGKIEIEQIPFDLNELIKNIYRGFKTKAAEKNLQLIFDIDERLKGVVVSGDPTRLTQILVNLIENAIKFTSSGAVNLTIKILEKSQQQISLHFCIRDTGIGIPMEKQQLVFDSFTQASTSTTRQYGGSGLGLAIVKNLLELHQSEIKMRSNVDVGTSFSFEINYKLSSLNLDLNKKIDSPKQMDISNLKVLVAEDNQMNILLMKKLLSKWDITPDFANNGAEAVAAFKTQVYDLILMDIHMPLMDGYEATQQIREDSNAIKASIPIIALTASVALDVRTKISEANINDYISKPFNPEELRSKLENIARTKSN